MLERFLSQGARGSHPQGLAGKSVLSILGCKTPRCFLIKKQSVACRQTQGNMRRKRQRQGQRQGQAGEGHTPQPAQTEWLGLLRHSQHKAFACWDDCRRGLRHGRAGAGRCFRVCLHSRHPQPSVRAACSEERNLQWEYDQLKAKYSMSASGNGHSLTRMCTH